MTTVTQAIHDAERLLPGIAAADGEIDSRWQAIIQVGAFIESHPEEIWMFIRRWGNADDADLRQAIATCLLEHLLEFHFDTYFPRVAAAAREDALFGDTVAACWAFGQGTLPENATRFEMLKNELVG